MNRTLLKMPLWAWALCVALAAPQPMLLWWFTHYPPAGTAPTGLHIADSALFLYSMSMFDTGFHSLYATCKSTLGDHALAFFPVPHLWLYGALGLINRILHMNDFMLYGVASAFGGFCYLVACYWLLRAAVPRHAHRAFVLFTLSGGLGGVLYIATGILGLHEAAGFDAYFKRFAVYELCEGPHLLPILLMPRFYYTLSLGLCLGALAILIAVETGRLRKRTLWIAGLLLAPGVFIDMRYGVFTLGLACLYLWFQSRAALPERLRLGAAFAAPAALGGALGTCLMRTNPTVIENHIQVGNMEMWLSPFLATAVFHLVLIPGEVKRSGQRFPLFMRLCNSVGSGYLIAFTLFFLLYQAYYGNLLIARDAAAAARVSDWALVGALAGGLYAVRLPMRGERAEHDWVVIWMLAFVALAISAFGQGWFLRYGPQRIEVLIWLPMSVVSAVALDHWNKRRPRAARLLTGIMIGCGLCSIGVSTLCFQAPLDYKPHRSPYRELHNEVMTLDDAKTMAETGPGTVLAPILCSDIFVRQRGNATVFGTGTFNMTDQLYTRLEGDVRAFYAPKTPDAVRKAFAAEWCVDYVYCPDTWPIADETVAQLRAAPWLEEVAANGRAALFRVVREMEKAGS